MIESFVTIRTMPALGIALYIVTLEKKRRIYALLPDDAEMSRETINRYKISNDLFEHFLTL